MARTKNPVKNLPPNQRKVEGVYDLSDFPSFSSNGNITGMRNLYYGIDAKLVRCGSYIYNVDSQPEIYDNYAR